MRYVAATMIALMLSNALSQFVLFEEQIDAFTDKDASFAALSTPDYNRIDSDQGVLFVRCRDTDVEVYVVFNADLGTGEPTPLGPLTSITYRFDSEDPTSTRWLPHESGTGVFAPSFTTDSFANRLFVHERLAFRATSTSGVNYTLLFQISDFPDYLRQLKCLSD